MVTTMLMGHEVRASQVDGLPLRPLLPSDIYAQFRPKSEWKTLGFSLKPDAKGQKMHYVTNETTKGAIANYYHESEVDGEFDELYFIRRAIDTFDADNSSLETGSIADFRNTREIMLHELKVIWNIVKTAAPTFTLIDDKENIMCQVIQRANQLFHLYKCLENYTTMFPPLKKEAKLADNLIDAWWDMIWISNANGMNKLLMAAENFTNEAYEKLCAAARVRPNTNNFLYTFDTVLRDVFEEENYKQECLQQEQKQSEKIQINTQQDVVADELVRVGSSYLCADGRFYLVDGVGTNPLNGEVYVLYHALYGDQGRGLILPLDVFLGPAERNSHRVLVQERNFMRCSVPSVQR